MNAAPPSSLHARLELSLHRVEVGRYTPLDLAGVTWPHWVISFVRSGSVETATRGVSHRAGDGDAMAQACGLGGAASLSRAFRAGYGAAPGQHRQSARRARQSVFYPPVPAD